MGDLAWTNERRKLSSLIPWEQNPRQIKQAQAKRLVESFEDFDQVETIAIGPGNELYNGHQRLNIWAQQYGPDFEVDVRVSSRPLTEQEKQKLTALLHKGAVGGFDFDVLANTFEVDDLLDWGFGEMELGLGGFDLKSDGGEDKESEPDAEPELLVSDVPDAVWPSDNEWGIPLLDINLQAVACDLPVKTWGASGRKVRMPGTWHFYTEDYRYEALWKDPSGIVNTRCANVVEPNFSCYDQMPPAVALWQIYRKRWLARWWQSYGIRVFADLNVAVPHYELNMLGIPNGWKAWATRGYSDRLECTEREFEMACERAGTDSILFMVYGGGKKVQELCQARGWLWFCEEMQRGLDGEG